jgi:tetraacyldisaccharide-1-P 4'-kinase
LTPTPRRYRGLHLIPGGQLREDSQPLNRLAQTQAIVAQVEREVAQRAQRERPATNLTLLSPVNTSQASLAVRAAHRVVFSLFPAGI